MHNKQNFKYFVTFAVNNKEGSSLCLENNYGEKVDFLLKLYNLLYNSHLVQNIFQGNFIKSIM